MSKLEQINQTWEALKSLATEKLTGGDLTDFLILVKHYHKEASNPARDYDTQEQEKQYYQQLNNLEKVKENEIKQSEILETLETFAEIKERLSQKLSYMENEISAKQNSEKILTELTSLKNNLATLQSSNILNKCVCDISLLEKKLDKIIELLNISKPITKTIEETTPPITQETPAEVKKPDQVEQTPPPITETPTKSVEELEREQEEKELQDLKDEVGKLTLNDLEKVLLEQSQDKEHIEAIRKQAQTRIDKEQAEVEQKEKERLELEQAEKERKEKETQELSDLKEAVELLNPNETEKELLTNATNKEEVENVLKQVNKRLEKEKAERERWLKEFQIFKTEIEKMGLNESEQKQLDSAIDEWQAKKVKESAESRIKEEKWTKWNKLADIIFNADKNISRTDSYKANFYNSLADFRENVQSNIKKYEQSFLLYRCKNGFWGLIYTFSRFIIKHETGTQWFSSSSRANWNIEVQEVSNIVQSSLGLKMIDDLMEKYEHFAYNTNKENSIKYSLMWSLAMIRKQRGELNWNWIKDESNWLSQMEAEFAKYGV